MPALELRPGSRVRIAGLKARPEFNGLLGDLVDFDEDEGRWRVRLDDGQGKVLRPCNLEALPAEVEAHPGLAPAPAPMGVGSRVEVRGLPGNLQELNGRQGQILRHDDIEQRWVVLLDSDEHPLLLRGANLEPCARPRDAAGTGHPPPLAGESGLQPGARVVVQGLSARKELNGMTGTLMEFDDGERRWRVRLDDHSGKLLKVENLRRLEEGSMEPGCRVRVHGLKARQDLNGQVGTVGAWDNEEQRWEVQLDSGGPGKLLKPENLEQLQPPTSAPRAAQQDMGGTAGGTHRNHQTDVFPAVGSRLRPGDRVQVVGFLARPDIDGLSGTLLHLDEAQGRWALRVDADGSTKMIPPVNLQVEDSSVVPGAPMPDVAAARDRVQPGPASRMAAGADVAGVTKEVPDFEVAQPQVPTHKSLIEPGTPVVVRGIVSQPSLNGQKGVAVEWDEHEARWKVLMDDGNRKMLKVANLEPLGRNAASSPRRPSANPGQPVVVGTGCSSSSTVPAPADTPTGGIVAGTRIRVHGIQAQSALNGQCGIAIEWDNSDGRWRVIMDDGARKSLRPANLEPCSDSRVAQGMPPLVNDEEAIDCSASAIAVDSRVRIRGILSQPHLNGLLGTAVEWDVGQLRWKVMMDNGSCKLLKASNLEVCHEAHLSDMLPEVGDVEVPYRTHTSDDEAAATTSGVIPIRPGSRVVISSIKEQPHLNGQLGNAVEWSKEEGRWKVVMDDGSCKMLKSANLVAFEPATAAQDLGPKQARKRENEGILPSAAASGRAQAIAPGARIVISGIQAQPHLNGQMGTIVEWDDVQEQWKVMMDDGSVKMFRPVNVEVYDSSQSACALGLGQSEEHEHQNVRTSGEILERAGAIVPGARVVVSGIKAQPHLNGQQGTAVEWDGVEERWKIVMDDGAGKMLRPGNLEVCEPSPTAAALQSERLEECEAVNVRSPAEECETANVHSSSESPPCDAGITPGARIVVSGIKAQPHLNGQQGTATEWDNAEGRWKVVMDDGSGKMLRPANLVACRPAPTALASSSHRCEDESLRSVDAPVVTQTLVAGTRVIVTGIKAQPHLNGQQGTAIEWENAEARWKVVMDDGSGKMLKPANLMACESTGTTPELDPRPTQECESDRVHSLGGAPSGSQILTPGARVVVSGIKAQPHLNSQKGTLMEWDKAEGRWKVVMDDGSGKMLRPANLVACESPAAVPGLRLQQAQELENQNACPPGEPQRGVPAITPGTRVVVSGIKAQPHLNGQQGTAVEWDDAERRWKVVMDDGSGKMLKPANLVAYESADAAPVLDLEQSQECGNEGDHLSGEVPYVTPAITPMARVIVSGIKAQPHLNGQQGTAVEWDSAEGRWRVVMDDGSGKMLKPGNLVACESADAAPGLDLKRSQECTEEGSHLMAEVPHVSPAISPMARVVVSGIKAQPQLNGQQGTAIEWDSAEARWKVVMDDGSRKMLKPANLEVSESKPPAAMSLHSWRPQECENEIVCPIGVVANAARPIEPGVRIIVSGIRAQPHLNGQMGTIVGWDEVEERWKVVMDDGSGKMLKPANVEACDSPLPVDDMELDPRDISVSVGAVDDGSFVAENFDERVGESSREHEGSLSISPGMRVIISGIRPLNGQSGTVHAFDEAEGRWIVAMDDGSKKMFRPMHLSMCGSQEATASAPVDSPKPAIDCANADTCTIVPGSRVVVSGIKLQPQLNGQRGTAIEFDQTQRRWKILMDDGSGKMLRPANLALCSSEVKAATAQDAQGMGSGAQQEPSAAMEEAKPSRTSIDQECGCDIEVGMRVVVTGIKTQQHMNGQRGTTVDWDEIEERWKVLMDDGSGKMLRTTNLRSVSDGVGESATQEKVNSSGDAPSCLIEPGARVRVCGISMQPELNGQMGTVLEWDSTESRWKVVMDSGFGKMLKALNLEVCASPDSKAQLEPPSAPQSAVRSNPQAAERRLDASSHSEPAGANHASFELGSRVRIHGIQAQPGLNGQMGTVIEWSEIEERWRVIMDDGSKKALRAANLEACALPSRSDDNRLADVSTKDTGVRSDTSLPRAVSPDALSGPPAGVSGHPHAASSRPNEVQPGSQIRIVGLKVESHLNGKLGVVVDWDEGSRRWKVLMSDTSRKMFRPCNIEVCNATPQQLGLSESITPLPEEAEQFLNACSVEPTLPVSLGSRICVHGVKTQPHLNGQFGTIVEWDVAQARWKTVMDDGSGKLLRPENVQVCTSKTAGVVPQASEPPGHSEASASTCARATSEADKARSLGSSPAPPASPTPAPGLSIRAGSHVIVSGVKAQPHLNGQKGTVVQWDESEERWKVVMDDGSRKMFKPSSLRVCEEEAGTRVAAEDMAPIAPSPCPPDLLPHAPAETNEVGARVVVTGVKVQAHLNGQLGTTIGWDEIEERWKVVMDDGAKKMFLPVNLQPVGKRFSAPDFAPGQRVRIRGVVTQPHLNGQAGTLVEFDHSEGRWRVLMDDCARKLLKPTNLELETDTGPAATRSGAQVIAGVPTPFSGSASWKIERGARVSIAGIKAQPHLNGQLGIVIDWDESQGRWKVLMDDGAGKMFRPANLVAVDPGAMAAASTPHSARSPVGATERAAEAEPLPFEIGSRVEICGLKAHPELNGLQGIVDRWNHEESRWSVRLDDGSRKMFRGVNLKAAGGSLSGGSPPAGGLVTAKLVDTPGLMAP